MLACARIASCTQRSTVPGNFLRSQHGSVRPFSCAIAFNRSFEPRPESLANLRAWKSGTAHSLRRSAWKCKVLASAEAVMENKRVLVPVANGTEEMEAVIIIDVLRRAGADVTVSSVEDDRAVTCSRGVIIVADNLIADCSGTKFDLIACPGGMPGAQRLSDSAVLTELLFAQRDEGRLYAAICATPAVFFESKGLIGGKDATAHPAFSGQLANQRGVNQRVVRDGTLTTSRGPGTAFEFALSLVEQLYGEAKYREVEGPMVMYPHEQY